MIVLVFFFPQIDDPIHVISIEESFGARQKPPDYEAVADAPPSYDDAIKLNPGQLIQASNSNLMSSLPGLVSLPGNLLSVSLATNQLPVPTPPPPYAR